MKLILLSAAALAVSSPALAEPNYRLTPEQVRTQKPADAWEYAYLGLSAVDAAETIYGLESGKADEANPLWGKHPSPLKVIAVKVAGSAIQYAIYRELRHKSPKTALRIAQISAVLQGTVVGLNARIIF